MDLLAKFEIVDFKNLNLKFNLQSRIDLKFIVKREDMNSLLMDIESDYKIIRYGHELNPRYQSKYFDTIGFKTYLNHHNGMGSRFKIRKRKYSDGHVFLENKLKHKLRTNKIRKECVEFSNQLTQDDTKFVEETTKEKFENLIHTLNVDYNRIALVSKESNERVTLDSNIEWSDVENKKALNEFIIVEIKTHMKDRHSKMASSLRKRKYFPINFSKYCVGMVLTKPKIKYNRFKPLMRLIHLS